MTATDPDLNPTHATILEAFDLLPDGAAAGDESGVLRASHDGTDWLGSGDPVTVRTPITNAPIARVATLTREEYDRVVEASASSFRAWRSVPAPERGRVVRAMGDALRDRKEDLAKLVALENGKILSEGEGEVQEMIDIADFAVGLSRTVGGRTLPSERPDHRMVEQWHPLGIVGVVTAFNFPVAVWSWNSFVAAVCGDTVLWKPSTQVPLCAMAVQSLMVPVLEEHGHDPAIFTTVVGRGSQVGDWITGDDRIPLVSATGSCAMGRTLYPKVAERFGRAILELGGNNAAIVTPSADLDLAERAILFSAAGTAGQRCTTLRRLIVHASVRDELVERLVRAYGSIPVGDPLDEDTLMGPLIDEGAVTTMMEALETIQKQGGEVLVGGGRREDVGDLYVEPTIVQAPKDLPMLKEETFAPILYVVTYDDFDEAIAIHNDVPQGLASSIFTNDVKEMERFLSVAGSDCGIANVNAGPSGAEIGGAFGGEKETGGGREAGSDSWKQYMRRQTVTINYGDDVPLSQGVEFGVE